LQVKLGEYYRDVASLNAEKIRVEALRMEADAKQELYSKNHKLSKERPIQAPVPMKTEASMFLEEMLNDATFERRKDVRPREPAEAKMDAKAYKAQHSQMQLRSELYKTLRRHVVGYERTKYAV
jgi:hypothetical protein